MDGHKFKGRERKEIKFDKVRSHDGLIKDVSENAKEAFKRKPYQIAKE